jgi:hypothetical protein
VRFIRAGPNWKVVPAAIHDGSPIYYRLISATAPIDVDVGADQPEWV